MTSEKTVQLTPAQIALVKEWAQLYAAPAAWDADPTRGQEAREILHACEDAERAQ